MKLLFDANLSWKLIKMLHSYFPEVDHVDKIAGVSFPPKDTEIWNYARQNNYIIVTNDEDFVHLMAMRGFPPKVVLLRTGNQSTKYIANILIKHRGHIEHLEKSTETGLLQIFAA